MGMETDVWSVTLGSDADFYVTTVAPTGAGSLTLAATTPGINGYGYKVSQTSASGDNTSVNFVITGTTVGGEIVSETLAGADGSGGAATVYSTNYFSSVTSITVSAATTGNITIGYGGDLAIPRVRIRDWYYIGTGSAGSLTVTNNGETVPRLKIMTPGVADAYSLTLSGHGILVGQSATGYAVVTTSNVTSYTLTLG